MKTFQELDLQPSVRKALEAMNFTVPTPIQAQAIPSVLSGRDLIGCAQTGTGKTAAFGLPILETLIANQTQTALVLVPTRELAVQVTDVIQQLAQFTENFGVVNLIGGMSMQHQLRELARGFAVIVATPGRLLDHLERKPKLLEDVSMFVLDEADRMLDMGFAPQLKRIYPYLPAKRQSLLFSATMPPEIQKMAERLLKNPLKVQVGEASIPADKIHQEARRLNGDQKNELLLDELNAREGSVLVFIRTQHRTDRVARNLESYGVKVARIHGGRSQGQRNKALGDFRDGHVRVLCATDIAARGIDISHVAHVINYDLPQVPEDYVHRIGRTARAGRQGEAMSFISGEDQGLWNDIEKLLSKKGIKKSLKIHDSRGPSKNAQAPKPRPTKQGYPKVEAKPVEAQVKPTPRTGTVKSSIDARPPFRAEMPKNIRFKREESSRAGFRHSRPQR